MNPGKPKNRFLTVAAQNCLPGFATTFRAATVRKRSVIAILILLTLVGALVASAADKQVSDDLVYDNVKRKLAIDPVVKGGALDIDVKQGIVTLRGKVEYEKQKVKAEKIAKKVSGVKSVVNEIQIKH